MIIPSRKGLIALDIDGTVTSDRHSIPSQVVDYLIELEKQGWAFVFITGRPFSWAYQTLQQFPFPFHFAVQNGAILLEVPSKAIIQSHYLSIEIIPSIELLCDELKTDFVIYTGYENRDICYYRKGYFTTDLLGYLLRRKNALVETWLEVPSFNVLPIQKFTALKCFGNHHQTTQFSAAIENDWGLHAPVIRDPFDASNYIVQATHQQASKGKVLQEILANSGFKGPVIAAGDDNNDFGMLLAADVKIVMADAPSELLEIADIIAPPASKQGLILGLSKAIEKVSIQWN